MENTSFYVVDAMQEQEKLSLVGTSLTRMSRLIQQGFAHTRSDHMAKISYEMHKAGSECEEAAQDPNADFISIFFLTKHNLLKPDRLTQVRYRVVSFIASYATLDLLLRYDHRIRDKKSAPLVSILQKPKDFLYNKADLLIRDSMQVYTYKNVKDCFDRLNLCQDIIGGEANCTKSAPRIFKRIAREDNPLFTKSRILINNLVGGNNYQEYEDCVVKIWTTMSQRIPDPSLLKRDIHPS